jgi:hypothetical protein
MLAWTYDWPGDGWPGKRACKGGLVKMVVLVELDKPLLKHDVRVG